MPPCRAHATGATPHMTHHINTAHTPARYMRRSVLLKSNDRPPVLRLMSASRAPDMSPPRSDATLAAAAAAAALAPDPAGSVAAPAAAVVAARPLPPALRCWPPALASRWGTRLSVMSVTCSRPLATVQAFTRPSVEMVTSCSSRSGPWSTQRTCARGTRLHVNTMTGPGLGSTALIAAPFLKAHLSHRVLVLARLCCAGLQGARAPAAHVKHRNRAVVHADGQHVGVALRKIQAGDACRAPASRSRV